MLEAPENKSALAAKFHVTKLDAARRQLKAAISLWFESGDPVAIHTLACAAHQIIHDINSKNGGEDLLFDSVIFKDEYRDKVYKLLTKDRNFFKHADADPDPQGSVEFCPDLTVMFIFMSLKGLQCFGESFNEEEITFLAWHGFTCPEFLTKKGAAIYSKISAEARRSITALPPQRFFKLYTESLKSPIRSR